MARTLSSIIIQYVPAVRRCNIIRVVAVILFPCSGSLGSQSSSAGAVPISSHGSCSGASGDVAFEKKGVVFAVLYRGREGTVLCLAVRIGCRGAFLMSLCKINSGLAKHTRLTEPRCLRTSLPVSSWSNSRAGLGNCCFLQARPTVGN